MPAKPRKKQNGVSICVSFILLLVHAEDAVHLDEGFVVLGAELDQLPGRLHVVQHGMDIGKKDGDLTARLQKVGNLASRTTEGSSAKA